MASKSCSCKENYNSLRWLLPVPGPGAFDFKQGDTSGTIFWKIVGHFLKDPSAEQTACQAPKPILLDTGSVHIPYEWCALISPSLPPYPNLHALRQRPCPADYRADLYCPLTAACCVVQNHSLLSHLTIGGMHTTPIGLLIPSPVGRQLRSFMPSGSQPSWRSRSYGWGSW